MSTHRPLRRSALRCALGLVALLALGACGDDADTVEGPGAQPAPDVTTFEPGRFDELPVYPQSEPYGARSEADGVVTRSYRAEGATPDDIIEYYARELGALGWEQTEPVFRSDTERRADWITEDYRLELSAFRVEDRTNPTAVELVTQFSLVLRPR